MNPDDLSATIVGVLTELADEGAVTLPAGLDTTGAVQRPGRHARGDYASTVALRLAEPAGVEPAALAELVAARLRGRSDIAAVEVARPGFLNVTIEPAARGRVALEIVRAESSFGAPAGEATLAPPVPREIVDASGAPLGVDRLVEAIGRDAARYALARHAADDPVRLDLGVWERADGDNPAYRVQYAAARTSATLANATDLGVRTDDTDAAAARLTAEAEARLLTALAEFPRVVAAASRRGEPSGITRYLEDIATDLDDFLADCPPLPTGDADPDATHRARLLLVAAVRVVLANGLGLLGVAAPERM